MMPCLMLTDVIFFPVGIVKKCIKAMEDCGEGKSKLKSVMKI
jgi:hypothetical protein